MHPFPESQVNRSLGDLCTFGIGGFALNCIEVQTTMEMQKVLRSCYEKQVPFFILGKGSNCLFSDAGFKGTVIINKIHFLETKDPGTYQVGAGYSFSLLGVKTAKDGWSGLEFASGIPASVGGAVFMNAGANGTDTSQTIQSVDFVTAEGKLLNLKKEELQFSYRFSSFQRMSGAIVSATFHLERSSQAREKQLNIIRYRQATQPYKDKSAGCIFRNPDGDHAGALIEACGLKGRTIGGAQVSHRHANFIINRGNATTQDVLELIALIQSEVLRQKGIALESEVRIV